MTQHYRLDDTKSAYIDVPHFITDIKQEILDQEYSQSIVDVIESGSELKSEICIPNLTVVPVPTENRETGSEAIFQEWKIKNEEVKLEDEELRQFKIITSSGKNKREKHKYRKKHECGACGYRTNLKANLTRHILKHKNPEEVDIFVCDRCDFKTVYKNSLQIHCRRQHENSKNVDLLKCDYCDYQTDLKSNLNKHILKHKNPDEVDIFTCDRCNFKTFYKHSLQIHYRRQHENLKKVDLLKCSLCDYQTDWKSNLNKHMLKHKNPEELASFKCDRCDFKSIYKSSLKDHYRCQHENPKSVDWFKCHQCSYQARLKNSLRKHLLIHKNPDEVDMFKCTHCDYKTALKQNIKKHLIRCKKKMSVCFDANYVILKQSTKKV